MRLSDLMKKSGSTPPSKKPPSRRQQRAELTPDESSASVPVSPLLRQDKSASAPISPLSSATRDKIETSEPAPSEGSRGQDAAISDQISLSDLIKKSGSTPPSKKPASRRESSASAPVTQLPGRDKSASAPISPLSPATRDKIETSEPAPSEGSWRQDTTTSDQTPKAKSSDLSIYDTLPSAIYQAAEQLKISMPRNMEQTLQNAIISLSKIFAKAIDPTDTKEGLLETTGDIVQGLSMLIALDSNFARIVQHCHHATEHLISHSVNSAVIAMDIARNLDKVECLFQEIGVAALLHDVGMVALGLDSTGEKKDPTFRKHVAKSVEILEEMKVPETIRIMVAQHHERMDGSGYPAGISGAEFLPNSQVLALAVVFERIMNESFKNFSPKDHRLPVNYVEATLAEFHRQLDPDILKAFISLRGFYPDGIVVELTNRFICRVIKQNEDFPLRPIVQVLMDNKGNHPDTTKFIDLRSATHLAIMRSILQNSGSGQSK